MKTELKKLLNDALCDVEFKNELIKKDPTNVDMFPSLFGSLFMDELDKYILISVYYGWKIAKENSKS